MALEGRDWICLGAIAAGALLLLAPHLAHPTIRNWDESFHQAVARGTYDEFLRPHLYADPLRPTDERAWWAAGVWLHKPVAPFWFAAVVMHVIGVTPLAWRLGGLLGALAAAWGVYLLSRSLVGRPWAALAAFGFAALPFGWKLVQGFHFADAIDCALAGWVTFAMLLLVRAIERDSWRWAAAAGAALAIAFLCKSVLALVPLGTAGVLWAGRRVRIPGPRLSHLGAMAGAFLLVATPWEAYSAWRWPDVFLTSAEITLEHVGKASREIGPWERPWDAIFNEVLATEVDPLSVALPLLAGAVLLVEAVRRRQLPAVACAVWLWSTWIIHSWMAVKVPAQVWSALPAAFVGIALLAARAWRSPPLAAAALATVASPALARALPFLAQARLALPELFDQTRLLPGLVEGLSLALAAGALAFALERALRRPPWLSGVLGAASAVALVWALAVSPSLATVHLRRKLYPEMMMSYSAELGPALDRALPKRAVLFQDFDFDPYGVFEIESLMFWSGRMVFRGLADRSLAEERGYAPYLVSPLAEPFEPVGDVPPQSWMRAYDLRRPAAPPPLPAGVMPLAIHTGGLRVLGLAAGPIDGRTDRYAIYVSKDPGPIPPLAVAFLTRDGREHLARVPLEASLRNPQRLEGAPWFVLPMLGPPRAEVAAVQLGDAPPASLSP